MSSILKGENCPIQAWLPVDEIEPEALKQLQNVTTLPWVYHHVAAMPDCHFGKGCTVGSVIAMKGAVCPAAVGVDIGCGVQSIETSLTASQLPDNLESLRSVLEQAIPVGFKAYDIPAYHKNSGAWKLLNLFEGLSPKVQSLKERAEKQMGTLGGGNHFIELCLDDEENVHIMLHSGSRNIGKEIAETHIKIAQQLEINRGVIDPDLSVFLAETEELKAYQHDLYWAQAYARLNRQEMMRTCLRVMKNFFGAMHFGCFEPIDCHHNYVEEELHFGENVFVTRKGAINAEKGEYGIIPGSMGTRSYIVRGLGNPDSFNSASHGAGRRMSRGKAKKSFTLGDLEVQTAGVCCRKDSGILDEIPGAYKDIDKVMENQKDLVKIVNTLHAVMCIKG